MQAVEGGNGRVLAVMTLRNEGAFLIDWLAHHRQIGFTDFLVFSNDCQDGTDQMLDRLQAMGWLTHVPNPGPWKEGPQWAALKTASSHPLTRSAGWVMPIDIDEFVTVHVGDGTLSALFAALPQATALPLTWRLFGNGGIYAHEDRPIPERFIRAAPAVMGWPWRAAIFKTLFRNDGTYGRLGVHRPRQPDVDRLRRQRWFDGSGRELPTAYHTGRLFSAYGQDNYHLAQLNHYALGSMQDYVLKCDRGRANRAAAAFDLSYWVERNLCQCQDRTLADSFARNRPWREALRADAALAALHGAAVNWRQQRFMHLMEQERYRALLGRLMMAPESQLPTESQTEFLIQLATRPSLLQ